MSVSARYLIVGASGGVGRSLHAALGADSIATHWRIPVPASVRFDVATMHLSDILARDSRITHAFLLHGQTSMDACARDPSARLLNVDATCRLIDQLVERGIIPVFASSDAVFDGATGRRTEEDRTTPVLEYGRQKLEVEQYLQRHAERWLIVRLAKVVGTRMAGDLLEGWMDELEAGTLIKCARDQILSPVHIDDVVHALTALVTGSYTGVFHLAGPDVLSRWDLLQLLIEELSRCRELKPNAVACLLADLPFVEPRPRDSSLSAAKLRATIGMDMLDMRSACARAAVERSMRPRS